MIDSAFAARLRRSPRRAAYYCAAVRSLADRAARTRDEPDRPSRETRTGAARDRARRGRRRVGWSAATSKSIRRRPRVQSTLEEAGSARAAGTRRAGACRPRTPPPAIAAATATGVRPVSRALAHAVPPPDAGSAGVRRGRDRQRGAPVPEEFGAHVGQRADRPAKTHARAQLTAFLRWAGAALRYRAQRAGGLRNVAALRPLSFGHDRRARGRARDLRAQRPIRFCSPKSARRSSCSCARWRSATSSSNWRGSTNRSPRSRCRRRCAASPSRAATRMLDAWRDGRTGFPLVDAGIRELHATGWMHPRVRAIAASFLCFDLGVDWRVGRDEWDGYLIEDDPALAAGNWQWIAGVGADLAAYPRIYNPLKQARRFDPTAAIHPPLDPGAGRTSRCRDPRPVGCGASGRSRCRCSARHVSRAGRRPRSGRARVLWSATRARSVHRPERRARGRRCMRPLDDGRGCGSSRYAPEHADAHVRRLARPVALPLPNGRAAAQIVGRCARATRLADGLGRRAATVLAELDRRAARRRRRRVRLRAGDGREGRSCAATIGYLVLPAYQRRGFGREAVGAMVRASGRARRRTLHAWIDVRNAASVALVEALRFTRVCDRPLGRRHRRRARLRPSLRAVARARAGCPV